MLRPFGMMLMLLSVATAHAEPELYETGPSEETSYIRFVNALDHDLVVASSNAKISLNTKGAGRVSRFYRVKAGTKLTATLREGGHQITVDVTGKPWEYITVAALPDGTAGIKAAQVKETPEDFNAMRASLALFNLDPGCKAAEMRGGAKNVSVFDDIQPFAVKRRLINPVKLSANVACGGTETSVDIPQMQAGERYSVFLFATKKQQAIVATDSN